MFQVSDVSMMMMMMMMTTKKVETNLWLNAETGADRSLHTSTAAGGGDLNFLTGDNIRLFCKI